MGVTKHLASVAIIPWRKIPQALYLCVLNDYKANTPWKTLLDSPASLGRTLVPLSHVFRSLCFLFLYRNRKSSGLTFHRLEAWLGGSPAMRVPCP